MKNKTRSTDEFQTHEKPFLRGSGNHNPKHSLYCVSCRAIKWGIEVRDSPFGAETYTSSQGKRVECKQVECAACGSGWPVYLVSGEMLHRAAPKRKVATNSLS